MNWIIKAISQLCNLQRDKYMKQEADQKLQKKKGTGFDDVLQQETDRLEKEGFNHEQ